MERAVKGLVDGRYQWVVFTSTNAVRAVWEKFEAFGLDARAFSGVKIACVGQATADKVRSFGITPELVPTGEQSSEGLLAEFAPYDDVFDRSTGSCCRAPTLRPRRSPRACANAAGRSTMSPRTAPSGPRRRRPRPAR